jgi:hypothetical protein
MDAKVLNYSNWNWCKFILRVKYWIEIQKVQNI